MQQSPHIERCGRGGRELTQNRTPERKSQFVQIQVDETTCNVKLSKLPGCNAPHGRDPTPSSILRYFFFLKPYYILPPAKGPQESTMDRERDETILPYSGTDYQKG